jgi:transposase
MKDITTIGIDIAKNHLQIHGKDAKGKAVLKKRLSRDKFLPFMANLPKCLVGMEACGGSNYWAIELIKLGFEVKLMSARKVKLFVLCQKNDDKDAEGCAIAVGRADMTFVPVKTKEQMDIQAAHRIRSFYVKHKTALMNMIRSLLLENGITIKKGEAALIEKINNILCSDDSLLTGAMKKMLRDLYESLEEVSVHKDQKTDEIGKMADEDALCQQIRTLPGIGPISASAVIAKIGNGSEFKNGREFSAYLGLVPKQNSSGEKESLGSITKHGDRYIRQLLIHGGRAAVKAAKKKDKKTGSFIKNDEHSRWIRKLSDRVGMNKASVAVANKNARLIIGLLKKEGRFIPVLAHGNC